MSAPDIATIDRMIARLEKRRDNAIYALIDHRIAKGQYRPEDRQHHFEVMSAKMETLERKLNGELQ